MEPIVSARIDEFTYMKVQPGDGTIYTMIFGDGVGGDHDNLYIAMGPGEKVVHGYFFRKSAAREMLRELVKWIRDGKSPWEFAREYHLFGYHASHSPRGDNWETTVMVLMSVVLTEVDVYDLATSPPYSQVFCLIEGVYNDDPQLIEIWVSYYTSIK